ncbi:hypothetical protein LCGC14_2085650 [marine sediment metagenome]|uniref:Uncharacterized protein n=1 Tax=marine sediment metagenome TaxID=412755 RepID=A0A0F9HBB2_9ZZZZ
MGAFDDRVKEGHQPITAFTVTSSTTALSYAEKKGNGDQREISSLKVQNQSSTGGENILISTDNGSSFFAVTPLATHEQSLNSGWELQIKSATGTPAYDLWFTVRP